MNRAYASNKGLLYCIFNKNCDCDTHNQKYQCKLGKIIVEDTVTKQYMKWHGCHSKICVTSLTSIFT